MSKRKIFKHTPTELCFAVVVAGILTSQCAAADDVWKSRTQVVWSKETRTLIRKEFRVWDPHPELGLDFLWEPRGAVVSEASDALANGAGTLSWHVRGAPDYDRQYTYSVFKGNLKDGRPSGPGALVVFRTGYSYTGEWLNGLMHGRGILKLENGDRYDGDFVAGKMEGAGKYVSSDGWMYQGQFRNGVRDGGGKLLLSDGSYRTLWRDGVEISRERAPDVAPLPHSLKPRLAAVSNTVKLKLSLDDEKNGLFTNADPDTESHVYDAEFSPAGISIHPGSKAFLEAWKGSGRISSGYEDGVPSIYSDNQFGPVFMTVQVQNEGIVPVEIADAFLDVASSKLDSEPYLEVSRSGPAYCGLDTAYTPEISFRNLGWGQVVDAKMTYSLGTAERRTNEVVTQLGTFDTVKPTSIVSRLRELGVDTDRLKNAALELYRQKMASKPKASRAGFTCEMPDRDDQNNYDNVLAACVSKAKKTGVFGKLTDFVFNSQNVIFTTMSGRLQYQWKSDQGELRQKTSQFSFNIPLVSFDIEMGEAGCQDATDRGSAIKSAPSLFSLDRNMYQIHLPKKWQTKIAQGTTKKFDFELSAPKTSKHMFQLVLKLTDGSQVASPMVDLSYFWPRISKR
jgi:hypothetical protein